MKELTFDEFCKIPMGYTFGLSLETGALRRYENQFLGVVKETYTPRNPDTWKWGKTKTWFYLRGSSKVFQTSDQIYLAYMEKVCKVKA